jgi:2-dehydro-3-deoxyphosphooctonate aldolase (KDO 8-P synthase)
MTIGLPSAQEDYNAMLPLLPFDGLKPFVLIAGPCVIEGDDGALNQDVAVALKTIVQRVSHATGEAIQFYFKSSYDKANRSSAQTYRGPGLTDGLAILRRIQQAVGVPILTDVHTPEEATVAGAVVDMLQIPAFLCRQTDLLLAAAETGKPVNIKKGQFLSPHDVVNCAQKVQRAGNPNVWITERGTTFGYNNLVVDMRSIPIVQGYGLPLIFDATHSVQLPGGQGAISGGQREFAPVLARSAIAAGCSGLFFETHPNPNEALSDGPNMIPLDMVETVLMTCMALRSALRQSTCIVGTCQVPVAVV